MEVSCRKEDIEILASTVERLADAKNIEKSYLIAGFKDSAYD